jgi:eukaryotic-like serine/threonine-protein kinase
MGEVYEAHDPELDRKVAIKLLRGDIDSGSPEGRLRLMREAQAIARVSHPSVITVYDVGTFGQRVFIAMELVEGHTLRFWAHAQPRAWPEVLEVFAAAGRGLAAAHERGLVHRDFKPDNVMITADGKVRVMDFGLVKVRHATGASADPQSGRAPSPGTALVTATEREAEQEADLGSTRVLGGRTRSLPTEFARSALALDLTQSGVSLGTPAYMSPEQFRNDGTDASSDQFSFCVALYETMYGQRPFAGANYHDLSEAVSNGIVRDAPEGAAVPAWLREVILRGLRVDPRGRWPSMNALLAEIEKHPAIENRRRFLGAAASRLAGVWELPRGEAADDTPTKTEIRDAFLATGKPYAATAYAGVRRILDRYVRRWCDLYVEACEATHVRGEQSAEVLDLRMACLQEGLADLAALVGMFRGATAEVVESAVTAASAIRSLDRCENIELLRAAVRPPEDPATRKRVDALRNELAEVRALGQVGRVAQAIAAIESPERGAREIGYGPLLADVLLAHGHLLEEQGALNAALPFAEEAFSTGIGCRHDEVAAEAATMLVGYAGERPEAAGIWSRTAEALLRRIGGHDLLWGWLYNNRGHCEGLQGRLDEALVDLHHAVAFKQRALGADHPDVGISVANIALFLYEAGQVDEAVEQGRRAVEIGEAGVGRDHPRTAMFLTNYSRYLSRGGHWAEAIDSAERALAIFEREAAPAGLYVFGSLVMLGLARLGAGEVESALVALERADRIADTAPLTIALRAQGRFALARALREAGQARDRSAALAATAVKEYERAPQTLDTRRELANITAWLADKPAH